MYEIIKFWIPKFVVGILLFGGIYFKEQYLVTIALFIYFVHLFLNQKKDIITLYKLVSRRLLKPAK